MAREKKKRKNVVPPSRGRVVIGWMMTAGICLGLLYGAYDLFRFCVRSDLFMVKEVRIVGTELLTKKEVFREMEIPARARLWQIRPERVVANLIRSTWIESVQVKRVLPQTLVVDVLERRPVAQWEDPHTGKRFVIDEKRWILCTLGELEERRIRKGLSRREIGPLPLIRCDRTVRGLAPGDRLDLEGLEEILDTYDVLWTRGEEWLADVDRFEFTDSPQGWTIVCEEVTREIRLGRSHLTRAMGKIDPVWRFLKKNDIRVAYIDLRFEEQGIVIEPLNIGVREWMELNGIFPEPEKVVG